MGNSCIGELNSALNQQPTQINLEKVSNGYIVGGYGFERKVTLTIGEALEIIRKEME